jgi:hypothetical protein
MAPSAIEAGAAAASAVTSALAIAITVLIWRGQLRLDRQGKDLQKTLNETTNQLQKDISDRDRLASSRAQLLPLWQYLSTVSEVDPSKPITPDVIKVVNTLELVGLCCEASIVDPLVIRRTFRETFLKLYRQVDQCGRLPGLVNKTGTDLLQENRAAMTLHAQLSNERLQEDRIKS